MKLFSQKPEKKQVIFSIGMQEKKIRYTTWFLRAGSQQSLESLSNTNLGATPIKTATTTHPPLTQLSARSNYLQICPTCSISNTYWCQALALTGNKSVSVVCVGVPWEQLCGPTGGACWGWWTVLPFPSSHLMHCQERAGPRINKRLCPCIWLEIKLLCILVFQWQPMGLKKKRRKYE